MKKSRYVIISIVIVLTAFLGEKLFSNTSNLQVKASHEKDEKVNMIIYDINEANKGTVEREGKNFTTDTDQSTSSIEGEGAMGDEIEGKIKTLPSLDKDNIEIRTLPVPDDMASIYLKLYK